MRPFALALLPVCLLAQQSQVPNPLSLPAALELAQKASPDVQLARLRVVESEALVQVQRAALKPQLNALVQSTYQVSNLAGIGLVFPGLSNRIGPFSTFDARPRLSMNVFDATLLSATRAARERAKTAAEEVNSIRERTLFTVAQLYLQTELAQTRIRAAQARRTTAEAVLGQTREKVAAGAANKLDQARAEEQVERERLAEVYARRDREVGIALLMRALGLNAGASVELAPLPRLAEPQTAEGLLAEALGARFELKALDAKKRALEADLERARRERLPKFGVIADAGAFGATIPSSVSTYTVAGTVSIPVYTGGRIENEIKAAQSRLEQWRAERRQAEQTIAQEVAQAQIEQRTALLAQQTAERAAAAARESLELARLRYAAGLTTNLDVVSAQGNLAQAEEESLRAQFEDYLARARTAQARGRVLSLLAP